MEYRFLLLLIALTAIFLFVKADTFKFPDQNDFKRECTLRNGTFPNGVCKKAKHCTTLTSKSEVNTCYFEKFEQYVCCDRDAVDNSIFNKDRKAVRACNTTYPIWLEVTHAIPAMAGEFPYMCALGWESRFIRNNIDYMCGGVLIESNFVLTAAHCAFVNGNFVKIDLPGIGLNVGLNVM